MLALLLEKQVQDVEVRVHIVRNIDIGLDLSLVLQLDDVVVLVNLWLPVVLLLDRLVVFLRYAVLQHYLLVEVLEEFVDKLALLLLFLFIKGFLLFLEVLVLGILLLAFCQSEPIEQLMALQHVVVILSLILLDLLKSPS